MLEGNRCVGLDRMSPSLPLRDGASPSVGELRGQGVPCRGHEREGSAEGRTCTRPALLCPSWACTWQLAGEHPERDLVLQGSVCWAGVEMVAPSGVPACRVTCSCKESDRGLSPWPGFSNGDIWHIWTIP